MIMPIQTLDLHTVQYTECYVVDKKFQQKMKKKVQGARLIEPRITLLVKNPRCCNSVDKKITKIQQNKPDFQTADQGKNVEQIVYLKDQSKINIYP